ncbi:MAG TPA: uracil-DNA glycosylase [Thermoanaerobaculia bacterium]
MTSKRFDSLLRDLGDVELSPRATNQFSATVGDVRGNAIRRRNLRLYLEQLAAIGPRMLLIGEAVSHRGGRLTGIAFVSETVMLAGVETLNGRILGADHGYRKATDGPRLSTEASATMVWGTIKNIDPLPLLWNAFPFHPFHEGEPESNRVPSAAELLIGQRFIGQLMTLFAFDQIVAIGNQAALSLTKLAIPHTKVRHPSMGGKNEFIAQMASLSQKKHA